MLPLRCFSGLATVTGAATLRVRPGRYVLLTLVATVIVFGRCLRSLKKINESALSELSGLESSRGAV
jgi:hypothetical protein